MECAPSTKLVLRGLHGGPTSEAYLTYRDKVKWLVTFASLLTFPVRILNVFSFVCLCFFWHSISNSVF